MALYNLHTTVVYLLFVHLVIREQSFITRGSRGFGGGGGEFFHLKEGY